MRRALVAILVVIALGSIAVTVALVMRSPRYVAWRYRADEGLLFERYKSASKAERRRIGIALYLIYIPATQDPDPGPRAWAIGRLGDPAVREHLGPLELKESKRALFALLADTSPCGGTIPPSGTARVCDYALMAACELDRTLGVFDWRISQAERDARCAAGRARLEGEVDGP